MYRDARAQRFEEGTAEIQKTTIARDLLETDDKRLPEVPRLDDTLLPDPRRGFEGKIALITGGTRGIGRALALPSPPAATTPIVNYRRNEEAAAETVAEIQRLGATGLAIRADLESLEEIEAMFDQVQERFGRLDFFVSNASASNFHHLMDLKPHHLERTFNLNVRAFVVGTQRAVGLMPGPAGSSCSRATGASVFPTYANSGPRRPRSRRGRATWRSNWPREGQRQRGQPGIIGTDSSFFYSTGLRRVARDGRAEDPQAAHRDRREVADCVLFLLSPVRST